LPYDIRINVAVTPDRFFLVYSLDPAGDAWSADLMVWAPNVGAFQRSTAIEDASRETLLERLGQSYPLVRILELLEDAGE